MHHMVLIMGLASPSQNQCLWNVSVSLSWNNSTLEAFQKPILVTPFSQSLPLNSLAFCGSKLSFFFATFGSFGSFGSLALAPRRPWWVFFCISAVHFLFARSHPGWAHFYHSTTSSDLQFATQPCWGESKVTWSLELPFGQIIISDTQTFKKKQQDIGKQPWGFSGLDIWLHYFHDFRSGAQLLMSEWRNPWITMAPLGASVWASGVSAGRVSVSLVAGVAGNWPKIHLPNPCSLKS